MSGNDANGAFSISDGQEVLVEIVDAADAADTAADDEII